MSWWWRVEIRHPSSSVSSTLPQSKLKFQEMLYTSLIWMLKLLGGFKMSLSFLFFKTRTTGTGGQRGEKSDGCETVSFFVVVIVWSCLVLGLTILQSSFMNDSHFHLFSLLICNIHCLSLKVTISKGQHSLLGGDGSTSSRWWLKWK